jgi:hypothetical protein
VQISDLAGTDVLVEVNIDANLAADMYSRLVGTTLAR